MLLSRNALSIVGFIFLCVGGPFFVVASILLAMGGNHTIIVVYGILGVAFVGLGAPLLTAGLRRGRRQLAALERGVVAEGDLVAVEQNFSVQIMGRFPWRIEYVFNVAGGPVRGTTQSLYDVAGQRRVGDRVWVVFLANDPQTSALWPPVR